MPHGAPLAGVDEAGRGPLAGPVVAAAVLLGEQPLPPGVTDSKQLRAERRIELAAGIRDCSAAWALGVASVAEIEQLNILGATMLAMQRAVAGLAVTPGHVLVDGNRAPRFECAAGLVPTTTVVRGDASEICIGAASILAKVHRDALMVELDGRFPEYGFARHKGYATAEHRAALVEYGATVEHRATYAPVRAALEASELRR
ncbi:MAG: ribonuclease HII [Pseudomonadota bacterium]